MANGEETYVYNVEANVASALSKLGSLADVINKNKGEMKSFVDILHNALGANGAKDIKKLRAELGSLQADLGMLKKATEFSLGSFMQNLAHSRGLNSVKQNIKELSDIGDYRRVFTAAGRLQTARSQKETLLGGDFSGLSKRELGELEAARKRELLVERGRLYQQERVGDGVTRAVLQDASLKPLAAKIAEDRLETLKRISQLEEAEKKITEERIKVQERDLAERKARRDASRIPPGPTPPTPPTPAAVPTSPQRGLFDGTWDRLNAGGGGEMLAVQARIMANYDLMGGISNALGSAVTFVTDFDHALKNLQAMAAITSTQMKELTSTIVNLTNTPFQGVEKAEGALILAQAGFSMKDIKASLEGVLLLATAVGTDLKSAVDVATSVIGVFNLRASDMTNVANTVTTALNESKLSMEQYTYALQYVGNIANQAGVSFEETTAFIAGMANTGIRSGSMIGTGFRQLMLILQAPTKKFKTRLEELGIALDQIDIRSHGLVGVFENLKRGGFTAADAMQVLETRTASAFAAVINSTDDIKDLTQMFHYSNAAIEANATQMESLQNKSKALFDQFSAFVYEITKPAVEGLKDLVDMLSKFIGQLRKITAEGGLFLDILQLLAIVGTGAGLLKVGGMVLGAGARLAGLGAGAAAGAAGAGAVGTGAAVGAAGTGATAAAAGAAAPIASGVGGWLGRNAQWLGLGGLGAYLSIGGDEDQGSIDKLEAISTALARAKDEGAEYKKTVGTLNDSIRSLRDQQESLTAADLSAADAKGRLSAIIMDLQGRYGDLGLTLNEQSLQAMPMAEALKTIDTELTRLRDGMEESFLATFAQQLQAVKEKSDILKQNLQSLAVAASFTPSNPSELNNAPVERVYNIRASLAKGEQVAIPEIAAARKRLQDASDGLSEDFKKQLLTFLDDAERTLKSIAATDLSKRLLERGQSEARLRTQAFYTGLEDTVITLQRAMTKITQSLATTVTDAQMDQGLADARQQVSDLRSEMLRQLEAMTAADRELFEKSSLNEIFQSTLKEIDRHIKDVAQESLETREKLLLRTIKALETEFKAVVDAVNPGNAITPEVKARAQELNQQITEAGQQLGSLHTRMDSANPDTSPQEQEVLMIERRAEALQREADARSRLAAMNPTPERQRGTGRERPIVKPLETESPLEEIQRKAEEQAAAHERITSLINQENELLEYQKTLWQEKSGDGLYDAYFDEQLLARRGQTLTNNIIQVSAYREQSIATEKAIQAELDATMLKLADLASRYEAIKNVRGREKEANELQRQHADLLRDQKALMDALNESKIHNNELTDEQNRLLMQQKVQTEELDVSIWKLMSDTAQSTARSLGGLTDMKSTMVALSQEVITSANQAFQGFFQNVTSGSMSTGQALKKMVLDFLSAVAQAMMNRAIAGMIGSLFGAAGGAAAGGATAVGGAAAGSSWVPMATGGMVPGIDRGYDSVPILARPGEFVLRKEAVDALGTSFVSGLNNVQRFAEGGPVLSGSVGGIMSLPSVGAGVSLAPEVAAQPQPQGTNAEEGGGKTTNVWVVLPQDRPPMGKNDVLAIVADDILSRGQTRKLIASVMES